MPVKKSLILVFLFIGMFQCLRAQDPIVLPEHLAKTHIGRLAEGDSMIYYQCHVDEASQELTTSSGQKITTKAKKLTITERFAIRRKGNVYEMTYAVSGVNDFPNKKFAYLTLKEVANWGFEVKASGILTYQDIILLSSFENKTHDITHYELKINKSCTNEVIIVDRKERVQLMVEGSYLLSKNMSFLLKR